MSFCALLSKDSASLEVAAGDIMMIKYKRLPSKALSDTQQCLITQVKAYVWGCLKTQHVRKGV